MIIIDPNNTNIISSLNVHEMAFPDITFDEQELIRARTTIKAAYSNIMNDTVASAFLNNLEWNHDGDIMWQNDMLNILSDNIFEMIEEWKRDDNDELLKRIFVHIQLWGGNTCRGFFLNNGGFVNNFNNEHYKNGIFKAINGDLNSLCDLLKLNYMGISFATKHMFFWSNKKLPIYDNIISILVFGRKPLNNLNHYNQYTQGLTHLARTRQTQSHIIERSLFNWADSQAGKEWLRIRKSNVK